MNVDEVQKYPFLTEEVLLIEKMLAEEKPILGICLGAQLIAKALGSRVFPNDHKEVGWHPISLTPAAATDPLFKKMPKEMNVLHWHGDTFNLPKNAVHLARSTRCENQAFRYGKNTYGLQFHLEVTPGMLVSWCRSKDGRADLAAAGEDGEHVLKVTDAAHAELSPWAETFFTDYLHSSFGKLLTAQ
jgi:GMP synthase-like glutamine amidotransferase